MVPTVEHTLLTVHGSLAGGDNWSCGLRTYHRDGFLSPASGQSLANKVANRWVVFANATPMLFVASAATARAKVDGVTIRELNIEGITEAQYEGIPTTAMTNAAQSQSLPNQCALAVTLLTARAGRTGKGRVYLPAVGMATTDLVESQVKSTTVATIAAAFKVLLDGINTDLAADFGSVLRLAVQSPTAAKAWFDDNSLADYNGAELTGFKIGTVIDTQRRRRSALVETYTQLAVA